MRKVSQPYRCTLAGFFELCCSDFCCYGGDNGNGIGTDGALCGIIVVLMPNWRFSLSQGLALPTGSKATKFGSLQ